MYSDQNYKISGLNILLGPVFYLPTPSSFNLAITYNLLNLQQSLIQNGTTVASYNWLSDGTKCGVVDNSGNGYDYTGSLIYSRSGSTRTLESIENGAGRIYYSGGTYNPFYYLTDHLGSTRAISNSSGTVVERNDYYPFGGQHGNSSYPQLAGNRFKYNGKELQTTGNTGFLDYGARMYDDVIGRWSVVDPMAEKYPNIGPNVFCSNNPVTNIDPNGMDWYRYEDEGGNVYYQHAEGDAGTIEVGDNTYENVGSSVNVQFGNGMYFNAFQNYTVTSSDKPIDVFQRILNNPGLQSKLLASNSDFSEQGKTQIMESLVRKGQESFLNHPVTKMTVEVLSTLITGGLYKSISTIAGKAVSSSTTILQKVVHGNSLKSLKPTWGYKLFTEDGTLLKNGITSKLIPEARYTKAFMQGKYMEAIPFPNRAAAYRWEFMQNTIQRGPLNLNMH